MFASPRRARFETVVRAYANDVFRYLYWLCRDRSLAEDLSQETFARAWAAWEEQRDEKALKAWLFTIARNEHARTYERKRIELDPEAELDEIVSRTASDPALGIDIKRAFALLPETYREPLLLQVLGGLSSAEIATSLGTSEDAINMRLSRARRSMREMLEGPAALPARRKEPTA
ncbi:MAG TPA: sigma-70 family RNA polymerase sigma factor [Usitatibacter sp.]|nr:sigma-70 family RNA polymerase sigma factor [Usitatibacter sp.]